MKKLALVPLLWLSLASASFAQSTFTMPPPAGVTVVGVQVVASCGGASLSANAVAFLAMDTTGTLCTKGASGTTTVQGAQSNASSGVAATSINVPENAYNYVWNGSSWDQAAGVPIGPTTPSGSIPVVNAGFTYTHITTATTTAAIKSGAGVLHTICVNSLGTVASAITVDDALTATTPTIAVINSLTLLGCQTYDIAFTVGLTIVTTGTVAPDVTVSWR